MCGCRLVLADHLVSSSCTNQSANYKNKNEKFIVKLYHRDSKMGLKHNFFPVMVDLVFWNDFRTCKGSSTSSSLSSSSSGLFPFLSTCGTVKGLPQNRNRVKIEKHQHPTQEQDISNLECTDTKNTTLLYLLFSKLSPSRSLAPTWFMSYVSSYSSS